MTPKSKVPQQLRNTGNFRLKAAKRVLVAHFLVGKKTSIREPQTIDSSIQIKGQQHKNNFPN
jgi:hypothetical protein